MSLIKMIKPAGGTIPFRLLKEGRGGLVYFYQNSCPTRPSDPNDQTFIYQVGTYNATTLTGVYFALSEQCCFTANIKSHIRTRTINDTITTENNSPTPQIRHKVSRLEGLDLKSQVTTRLHATLSRMGFNVTNAGVTKPYTKCSLMMVNPSMHHSDGSEQVGAYVAQAVWDYLGLKKELYPVDVEHSGFVLQHLQKPVMVPVLSAAERNEAGATTGGKPSDLEMFEEREEEGEHIGDWTFEVEEREDWEADKGQECS
jgi:hypothetical protein